MLPGSWLVATSWTSNRRGEGEMTVCSLLLGMKDIMKKLGKMKFGESDGCLSKVRANRWANSNKGN